MKFDTRPYIFLKLESDDFSNPRRRTGLEAEEIRELALHIGRHGLRVPLTILPDGTITAGQRRYLAIGTLIDWYLGNVTLGIDERDVQTYERRALEYRNAVPCTIEEEAGTVEVLALAMADNLLRSEMSTYDVAEQVMGLVAGGTLTLTGIADKIGRSRTYVSKMASAWRGACPELKAAWASDAIAYSRVQELADLPPDQQRAALVPQESADEPRRRGPHGRPGVDAIKSLLCRCQRALDHQPTLRSPKAEMYLRGYVEALKVATGASPLHAIDEVAAEVGGVLTAAADEIGDGYEPKEIS